MKEWKSSYISKFTKKVRDFNGKHRLLVPLTIIIAMIWIFLISFVTGIIETIISRRRIISIVAIILVVVSLVLVVRNNPVFKAPDDKTVSTSVTEADKDSGNTTKEKADVIADDQDKISTDPAKTQPDKKDANESLHKAEKESDKTPINSEVSQSIDKEKTEDKKTVPETTEKKSEGKETVAETTETKSEDKETLTETTEKKSEGKETVAETTETKSEDKETVTEATETKSEDKETAPETTETKSEDKEKISNPVAEKNEADDIWDAAEVDFVNVKSKYPEAVAWLYFEDGSISYPIMQGEDNLKYLSKGYTGEEAWEGAISLDYRSAEDFSDPNSIVYGHNMKDGSMFGAFKKYKFDPNYPNYYKGHQYFQIITGNHTYRYQIFAYMDVEKDYKIYNLLGDRSVELLKDMEYVRRRSYINTDEIIVDENKRVVTLSTCTPKDPSYFVICGVKIDEK